MDKVEDMEIVVGENNAKLLFGGRQRALLERRANGDIRLHWWPFGPFTLEESRVWVAGLVELLVIAERWKNEKK